MQRNGFNRTKNKVNISTREDMLRNSTGSKYKNEFNFRKKKKTEDDEEEEQKYHPTKRDILESKYANREKESRQRNTQTRHMNEIVRGAVDNANTAKLLNRHPKSLRTINTIVSDNYVITVFDNEGQLQGYIKDIDFTNHIYTIIDSNLSAKVYNQYDAKIFIEKITYFKQSIENNYYFNYLKI